MKNIGCLLLAGGVFLAMVLGAVGSSLAADWAEPATGIDFVRVEGGCFQMGQRASESEGLIREKGSSGAKVFFGDELPLHEVCVEEFYLSRTEITVGQFKSFIEASSYKTEAEEFGGCQEYEIPRYRWQDKARLNWRQPGFSQKDEEPVVCVSWNDAMAMVNWLSGRNSDRVFRLAAEAEWEYAARDRGGDQVFGGGDTLAEVGWSVMNSPRRTSLVAIKKAGSLGIFDLSGNVWEWVADTYQPAYASNGNPNEAGATTGPFKVVRGGGWNSYDWNCRVANRDRVSPSHRDTSLGLRLVMTVKK
ncbi:MAG: formylglycine-generating enzyme family protein [Proteobacteria bacterium]|nr:formylglycine-generating enzyme family protein [Pseudomonadota bacterium]MBU1688967.1 formylglycine-generating enzyme family protein [Pseudomonadota bacterium]